MSEIDPSNIPGMDLSKDTKISKKADEEEKASAKKEATIQEEE